MHFQFDTACDYLKMPESLRGLLWLRYTEPHRIYHTVDHLNDILSQITSGIELDSDPATLLEMILFHDVVYEPRPVPLGYNEAASIAFYIAKYCPVAYRTLEQRDINRVVEGINAPAYHLFDQKNLSLTTQLFLDYDLSSFAMSWDEFLIRDKRVEEEFSPIVGKEVYNRSKGLFLQKLLSREKLYYVKTEWEGRARLNIMRRLEHIIPD